VGRKNFGGIVLKLIEQLYRTDLFTIVGLIRLIEALMTTGINLMAMLRIAAKLHPQRIAVIDERDRLSYTDLWQQAESLAIRLQLNYDIQPKQKVAIACRNHASAIKSIFALSRLGTHVFLLNPEMSPEQILALAESHQFDFYIYDEQIAHIFANPLFSHKSLLAYHLTEDSIDRISSHPIPTVRLKKVKTGNIIVMTGGTTGQPKSAIRKPSIFNFLPPFFALLTQVHLDRYKSVYIATPIYHGFGVASLFIGVALGSTMYFTNRFKAERACELVEQDRVEVVVLVPLMLQRMLQIDSGSLASLQCIITGGALLNPVLAQETFQRLGAILFNLYGTSEAGFCIMATADILVQKPGSIGKPIRGVHAKIVDNIDSPKERLLLLALACRRHRQTLRYRQRILTANTIGRLCIRSAWTTSKKSWIETGDLAYRDLDGDLFLCGRVDDMIVSGGENVYPIELENIIILHPDVESVGVIGIADPEFGQRLKAVIKLNKGATLDRSTLIAWLKPRVARYQMPAIVEFRDELPYTALGKLDKKSL
jgi:fatty-acyl-CoA synthase